MSIAIPALRALGTVPGGGVDLGPWTPDLISPQSQLKLWLRGDDAPPQAVTEFPTWADKRGSGIAQVTRVTAANCSRNDTGLNSHRFVESNGTAGSRMDGTTSCKGHMRNAPSATILAVFRPNTGGTSNSHVAARYSIGTAATSDRLSVIARVSANDKISNYRRLDSEGSASQSIPGVARGVDVWAISGVEISWQAASVSFLENGTVFTTTYNPTTGLTSDTDSVEVSLFGNVSAVTNNGNNSMAELLVCQPMLSLADRQNCVGYLAWKYGLQTILPSDHPFKNSAPTAIGVPALPVISGTDISGPGVVIDWTYSGAALTSFSVRREDQLTGAINTFTGIAAAARQYTDNTASASLYRYWVIAINALDDIFSNHAVVDNR